jgi:hypothetical protein
MQLATPEIGPLPDELSALQIESLELNATPATPLPLWASAATGPGHVRAVVVVVDALAGDDRRVGAERPASLIR